MLHASTVYLNGQFISHEKAFISPDDRGFYFADGVYEVIKFYKNRPFCFEEHLERLRNSLQGIRIDFRELDKIHDVCNALIEANQLKKEYAGVYIQITRGVSSRNHRFPENGVRPTIYARAFLLQSCISEMLDGVSVLSRKDIRWLRCNIKSIALLPNTLLFEEVAQQGAFECVLVRDGLITEATHSNILFVKNDTLYTHPDSELILPGITKAVVLNLCRKLSVSVVEKPVKLSEVKNFNECFMTGTGSEIIPVVKFDNIVIGKGKPGPVTRMLQKEFFRIT